MFPRKRYQEWLCESAALEEFEKHDGARVTLFLYIRYVIRLSTSCGPKNHFKKEIRLLRSPTAV